MWGPGRLALAGLGSGSQRPFQSLRGPLTLGSSVALPPALDLLLGSRTYRYCAPAPDASSFSLQNRAFSSPCCRQARRLLKGPETLLRACVMLGPLGSPSSYKVQRPLACTPEPSSEWVRGHRRTQGPKCDPSERLLVHDPFSPVSFEGQGSISCMPAMCWAPGAFFHLPDL